MTPSFLGDGNARNAISTVPLPCSNGGDASRSPLDAAAVSRLADGYAQHLETFRAAPDHAKALLSIGASPASKGGDAAEHAALTSIAMVLLNLDTTVTQE